jgi:hypothetical protein
MLTQQLRYDLIIGRTDAMLYIADHGMDAFMAHLETMAGGDLDLFGVSTDWLRRSYITTLKAKGSRGDLLVKLV